MSREDGMKYKEIAAELNISVKTVENQMEKALSTLRTELSEYLPAIIMAQLHKSVAIISYYPKIIVVLYIKNGRSCTPRSCALKPFNFELRDSA